MYLSAIRLRGTEGRKDGVSADADDRRDGDDEADRTRPKSWSGIAVVVEAVSEPQTAGEAENDAKYGAEMRQKWTLVRWNFYLVY